MLGKPSSLVLTIPKPHRHDVTPGYSALCSHYSDDDDDDDVDDDPILSMWGAKILVPGM